MIEWEGAREKRRKMEGEIESAYSLIAWNSSEYGVE